MTATIDTDMENLEIPGKVADDEITVKEESASEAASQETPAVGATTTVAGGGVSQWIIQKLQPAGGGTCGDIQDVSCNAGDTNESFQPLKLNNSNEETLDDADESSLRQRNGGDLTGIEVEIGSSCSNDDCLYRRRYLNTIWTLYKRQILLGCSFLGIFLFGVLIGACGSGQCGAKDGRTEIDTAALKAQQECNGGIENGTVLSTENSDSPYETTSSATSITNTQPNLLGPNVFVFDPSMSTAEIQSIADAIFKQQQNNEMGTERYSLLFEPGTYGSLNEPLMLQIGYYTEIAGLGESPTDVRIMGKIEVYNRVSTLLTSTTHRLPVTVPYISRTTNNCFSFHSNIVNFSVLKLTRTKMANLSQHRTRKRVSVLH